MNQTARWSPHRLPRIRRDLARAHDRAADELTQIAQAADHNGTLTPELRAQVAALDGGGDLRQLANQYRAAELFWVTSDMARLALRASGDLPEWTPAAARPSTFGLLVWDGGLPHLAWRGAPEAAWTRSALGLRMPPTVQLDGVTWAPDSGGVRLGLLTRTDALADALVDRWRDTGLFAFADVVLPLLDPVPTTSSDWSAGMIAALGATWLMMQQPTVADVRPLTEQRAAAGAARVARPDREVRIIDLRRALSPTLRETVEDASRTYRHRWVVSSHWRQQACGPGRSQRRPVFVPAHLKGPEGAPMLETEHVHVWRR